jgi:hypothetical protein
MLISDLNLKVYLTSSAFELAAFISAFYLLLYCLKSMKPLATFSLFSTIFTVSFVLADNVQLSFAALAAPTSPQPDKPNFVFILSDDQDYEMDSLDYMPLLKKYLADEGTRFERHYATTAQCCPSRASLWTGKQRITRMSLMSVHHTVRLAFLASQRSGLNLPASRCLGEVRRARS